jgi:hypothetical protein
MLIVRQGHSCHGADKVIRALSTKIAPLQIAPQATVSSARNLIKTRPKTRRCCEP